MDDALFEALMAQSARQATTPTPTATPTPTQATTSNQPQVTAPAAAPAPTPVGSGARGLSQADLSTGSDTLDAALGGAARAIFETKDFLTGGETKPEDQSAFRRTIEQRTEAATEGGIGVNSAVSTISQFATGMLGAGRLVAGMKMIPAVGEAATAAAKALPYAERVGQSFKAATVGAIAFDPHQERLSNLAEQVPVIGEPLFGWLAAHPDDSEATGRFKAALEGIGLDAAFTGLLMGAGKVYKLWRGGAGSEEIAGATKELQQTADEVATKQPPEAATEPVQQGEAPVATPTTANENAPQATGEAVPNVGEAQAAPTSTKLKPGVTVTPEDADALIAKTRSDLDAIDTHGTVVGAAMEGHNFAEGAGVPWAKLNQPEDLQNFTAAVAEQLKPELDKVKGGDVLTDQKVARQVSGMASYFNVDAGTIMGRIQEAGQDATRMVANMEAAYLLSNKMHMDAFSLANRIGLGDYAGFASHEEAVAEFQRMVTAASSMFGSGQSMRAAMGRGMRRLRSDFAIPEGAAAQIEALGGDKLMTLFRNTMGDPKKLALASQPSFLKKAAEELGFWVQNNLLWGWGTHVVNTVSNAYMAVGRPIERILGGSIQQGLGIEGGQSVRSEAVKQLSYMVSSWSDSLPSVVEALKAGDGILNPRNSGMAGEVNRVQGFGLETIKPMDSWANILHNAYAFTLRFVGGLPTRVLTAADEMTKQTVYRSKVAASANMEGMDKGLAGPDLQAFVKDRLDKAFDEAGQATDKDALKEAQVATFSQDLLPGSLGTWIRQGVAQHPLLRLILPFTQTPTNIFRYTWKMTPGAQFAQTEFRKSFFGQMGPEAQANALGQFAIGSLAIPAIAYAGLNLTGGGPQDPKVRGELMNTGWRPYSLVVQKPGGDGTKYYLPIGRIDPISLPFGIVADIHDYLNMPGSDPAKAQGPIAALAFSLIKQAANKTYMQGVVKAFQAFTDPQEGSNLLKFSQGILTEVTPFSSALRNYNLDPFMRDARSLTDALVAITPGLSPTLPAHYDGLGQKVLSRSSFISSSPPDKVTEELQRLEHIGYTIPPATPSQGHADLRDITMEDGRNAFEVYQQLGGKPTENAEPVKNIIGRIMDSEAYQRAPDGYSNTQGTKPYLIEGPVTEYRRAALGLLMKDTNVRTAVNAEQKRVADAYRTYTDPKAAAQSHWDTLKDIGAKFGMALPENVPTIPQQ